MDYAITNKAINILDLYVKHNKKQTEIKRRASSRSPDVVTRKFSIEER